jgi:signal transduction histidine kinase/ligand-binding sensor domain-containing protein
MFRLREAWLARLSRRWAAALHGITLLAIAPGAFAGNYMVQVWGLDEGLPQSSVTDLKQMRDGYLWIGTLFGGLARFDGRRFETFDPGNTPVLLHPGVRRLLSDSADVLWINDYGGNLVRFQRGEFIREELANVQLGSLVLDRPGVRIFSTLNGELISGKGTVGGGWTWTRYKPPHAGGNPYYICDERGDLWYRAPGSKLGRVRDGQFETIDNPPGLRGKQIFALAQGATGGVWVGTEVELARWEGEAFQSLNPPGESRLNVRQIIPVTDERAWVEANGRLRLLEKQTWIVEAQGWDSGKAPWSRVRLFRKDNAGGLWVSLREEGLAHVLPDGTLERITAEDGLPSQVVQAFYPDEEGNLWTGYHRGGLVRVRRSLFRTVARPEGLADTVVTSVGEDSAGRIWIGTAGGAVARWDNGVCTNLSLPLRGAFTQESVVAAGTGGRVWIGTVGNGLLVFEDEQFRHVVDPSELSRGVRTLLPASDGTVWFANFAGLYRVREDQLARVREFRSTGDVCGALAEGPDGTIWMGTLGGALLRLAGGEWKTFEPADGHPPSRFWALLPDADGSVWIGTLDKGLLRFHDGAFARLTRADGIPDQSISQILFDGEDLWLGTRAGVVRASRAALVRRAAGQGDTLACRVFGRDHGLLTTAMALEFGPNCARGQDGRLWFSSAKGVAWTKPSDVAPRRPALPVVIERVYADGKTVEDTPASNRPERLKLGPGVRTCEIEYTAPSLSSAELVQFRYRLDGVDAEWLEAGPRRSVTYSRLPPGKYRFSVSAQNSDGIWSNDGAHLNFEIVPHFWERRSFIAGTAVVLAGLAIMMVRAVTRRRMQRKLDQLERQRALERERARIAQDLHDDLGAGLTEISLTSDLACDPGLDHAASSRFVGEIGGKARELVATMDEIVWAVNPRNDSVPSLAAYFCQFAQHLLKPAGIRCRLDVAAELPLSPLNSEHRHQLFLAFKEALNNVVRHSGAGEVCVAIEVSAGHLQVSLKDDGQGLSGEQSSGSADGLRNMRERLSRIGGACAIASAPQHGTTVVFRVPLPALMRSA